jgi:hypothetical protein
MGINQSFSATAHYKMEHPKKLILEVVIERKDILLGNQFEIAAKFSPEAMTVGDLRIHYDSLIFSVRGFEADSQPIFAITEVRDFFQKLHKEWPYFLYFCHAGGQGLWNYIFFQLSTLRVRPKGASNKSTVDYSPGELFQVVGDSLVFLEKASERAGFDSAQIRVRSREMLKYFKFLKGKAS